MTGEGMALPNEDAAELERRFANFHAEMAPTTELGRTLTLRVATLSVRLERCYRNEAARLTVAVDSAEKRAHDARVAALDALVHGLGDDPHLSAYQLQQSPEGLRLTAELWGALRAELTDPDRKLWNGQHHAEAENLMGRRTTDLPRSRVGALSRALWHDFSWLDKREASGLNDQGKYEYARDKMVELIDERIATIDAAIARFDESAGAREHAALKDRALFDDAKESILARKYEAATERSLFRTLREFREVEAEAAAKADESEATPEPEAACEDLASSLPDPVAAVVEDPPSPPPVVEKPSPAAPERLSGRDQRVWKVPPGAR